MYTLYTSFTRTCLAQLALIAPQCVTAAQIEAVRSQRIERSGAGSA